jgi:hypothetical protein
MLLIIIFKKEDDFNYEVGNYKSITIKILSKSNIGILNQINIVFAAVKVFKKCGRLLNLF